MSGTRGARDARPPSIEPLPVLRMEHCLRPDSRRVQLRPHLPGLRVFSETSSRASVIFRRLMTIDEEAIPALLFEVEARFAERHLDLNLALERHYKLAAAHFGSRERISPARRRLIGAYFSMEYSIESAALFNPSMVPALDQSNLPEGSQRFVLSLRAVGEGHISSIEFRGGVLDGNGGLTLDPHSRYVRTGHRASPLFDRRQVLAQVTELGADSEIASLLLGLVPVHFEFEELEKAIGLLDRMDLNRARAFETVRIVRLIIASNYEVSFPPESDLAERVLCPAGPRETQGMEDARFVRFEAEDGSSNYYATYTAYDGFGILPQLIDTRDFLRFRVSTLSGKYARNKGMALFPRLIGGRYAMLARHDEESIHLMYSDDVRSWSETTELTRPRQTWAMLQMGNCGAPIETEAGWLVLTHGVGPLRRYCIGAMLLDREDPTRVLSELPAPLLEPLEHERDGYVPNVVYSCGGMIHGGWLVLPYGFSDYGSSIALVPLDELLERLAP